MKRSLFILISCLLLGFVLALAHPSKTYEYSFVVTELFPIDAIRIGNKVYKNGSTIKVAGKNKNDCIERLRGLRIVKKEKDFSFKLLDKQTGRFFTFSTKTPKEEKEWSIWGFLCSFFVNYNTPNTTKKNGVKSETDNTKCGDLIFGNDSVTTDTIESFKIIDQYHFKNIENKRDTTILLMDTVDIRVDIPKNKKYYLIYQLKNGKMVEKELSVISINRNGDDNKYVRIMKSDCDGLSAEKYPDGIDAVLLWRNVKLLDNNEERYTIRLFPLY